MTPDIRKQFEERFPSAVMGTLSGDKSSPVFVNNELEIPRFLRFIEEKVAEAYAAGKQEGREELALALKDELQRPNIKENLAGISYALGVLALTAARKGEGGGESGAH